MAYSVSDLPNNQQSAPHGDLHETACSDFTVLFARRGRERRR